MRPISINCIDLMLSSTLYFTFSIIVQIQNAAEEPRVLCIIQDTTNARTVNERLTLNLPVSTTLSKLHEDVAHKAGYLNGTFELTWGNAPNMVCRLSPFLSTSCQNPTTFSVMFSVASCTVTPQQFPVMLV